MSFKNRMLNGIGNHHEKFQQYIFNSDREIVFSPQRYGRTGGQTK